MKKFKTFLPIAFIGICSFAASTSCDSGDRSAEETAELETIFSAGQSKGIDLAVVASNPNGIIGLPFALTPGDRIEFSGGLPGLGDEVAPGPLSLFTVTAPNLLRQADSANATGNEEAFTQIWTLTDGTTNISHSDATRASIILDSQHLFSSLGAALPALPPGYLDLFSSSTNAGSLNSSVNEFFAGTITPQEFNIRQRDALNSINLLSFIDPDESNQPQRFGPMIRFQQELTLDLERGDARNINSIVASSREIHGTYTLTQSYYQVANEGSIITNDDGTRSFSPTIVLSGNAFFVRDYVETGSFTIRLSSLTL